MNFLMKHYLIAALLINTSVVVLSQTSQPANLNPDPDGEPWIADGYYEESKDAVPLTKEEIAAALAAQKSAALPPRVENHTSTYARPCFSQVGGSCGSASRICYMFAYELNSYYRRDGKKPENMYPSHFTWMLTNQGSAKEEMARDNGVPNSIVYGGETYSKIYGTSGQDGFSTTDYGWMTGYDKWYQAMQQRILKTRTIRFSTPAEIEVAKGYLFNHNGDISFATGGYLGFGCASSGMKMIKIPEGLYEAGKNILISWGPTIDHGTTYTGYDDSVGFDSNNDGKITNDMDINNDGKVDLKDWEKGALIFLNTWGTTWADKGALYVPYRLAYGMSLEIYPLRKDYEVQRTMKITLSYSQRAQIRLSVGISSDVTATQPKTTIVCHHFNYGGRGDVPMLGKWANGSMHTEPMEFGYDLTDLSKGYDLTKEIKYFLVIDSKATASGTGTVASVSVIDYQNNPNTVETVSKQTNVTVIGSGQKTLVEVVVPGVMTSNNQSNTLHAPIGISYRKTGGTLIVSLPAEAAKSSRLEFSLFSANGKTVSGKICSAIVNNSITGAFDISNFAKGIYFCRISGSSVKQLVKIKI